MSVQRKTSAPPAYERERPATELHLTVIVVRRPPKNYQDITLTTYRDLNPVSRKIQPIVHHLYLDEISRNKDNSISLPRGVTKPCSWCKHLTPTALNATTLMRRDTSTAAAPCMTRATSGWVAATWTRAGSLEEWWWAPRANCVHLTSQDHLPYLR